jgi:hypothetical protein
MSASIPKIWLIGSAVLAAVCTLYGRESAASQTEARDLLDRAQQILETQQLSNLNALGKAFGGTEWVQVRRTMVKELNHERTACETTLAEGGTITAFIFPPTGTAVDCSQYTRGTATNDPMYHYIIHLSLNQAPCITFADMQEVGSRTGWRFEQTDLRSAAGTTFVGGSLRWAGPSDGRQRPEGNINFNVEKLQVTGANIEAKPGVSDRCAYGIITLASGTWQDRRR